MNNGKYLHTINPDHVIDKIGEAANNDPTKISIYCAIKLRIDCSPCHCLIHSQQESKHQSLIVATTSVVGASLTYIVECGTTKINS